MIKIIFGSVATVILVCIATAAVAQDAGEVYRARLNVAGYLLRSAMACGGGSAKRTIDKAMRFASGGDLKQFNKAFPKKSEEWMKEGAGHFNDEVMQSGLTSTCGKASNMARRAP